MGFPLNVLLFLEASSDGISTGVEDYVWQPKEDYLKIGMGEMNFNKKYRGYRKPNDNPIVEEDDLDQIIPKIITRRLALSKTAKNSKNDSRSMLCAFSTKARRLFLLNVDSKK